MQDEAKTKDQLIIELQELRDQIAELEKNRAEEALRESEARLRQIIDLEPHKIFVRSCEGKYLLVNKAAAEAYNTSVSDLTGKYLADLHPDGSELRNMLQDDRKVITTGKTKFIPEEPFTDARGNLLFLQTTKVPFHIIGDKTPAVLGVAIDITKRKRAEECLRETELRLKIAMDLAKLVQWEYDVKTDMFSFDEQFYALYGTTSRNAGGSLMSAETYARKFIPPEESHIIAEEIAKALATTDPNFTAQLEHRMPTADGQERHIIVRYVVVRDQTGRVVRLRGANQDITERKQAEEALKDNETRLRAITDSARDAILMMDPKGMITYWNPSAERILGYSTEEAIGQNLHRLLAPQRYHAAHDAVFPEFVETGRDEATGKTLELVARRKDG